MSTSLYLDEVFIVGQRRFGVCEGGVGVAELQVTLGSRYKTVLVTRAQVEGLQRHKTTHTVLI